MMIALLTTPRYGSRKSTGSLVEACQRRSELMDDTLHIALTSAVCASTMEWTPPPDGIAMCQDGAEAIQSTI